MANPRLAVSFTGMAAHPNASRPRFAPRASLFAGLALLLLSACGESPEAHELRVLREANASLRQQLISSEQALAQARAELAARPTVATAADPAQPVPFHEDTSSAPETTATAPADSAVEDTTYIVVSKHHVPGRLSPQPTGADPTAARRIPPVYQVTFRGEQSSRVYPRSTSPSWPILVSAKARATLAPTSTLPNPPAPQAAPRPPPSAAATPPDLR